MIIEEIDESLFISRFEDYKRVVTPENPNGNFTYKGLRHLFSYLDELSEDVGEPLKLDVIALCCDYSEYENLDEYLNDYYTTDQIDEKMSEIAEETGLKGEELRSEFKERMKEQINEKTTLILCGDDLDEGFIIQSY